VGWKKLSQETTAAGMFDAIGTSWLLLPALQELILP
jgi:hypothetical protein